MKDHSEVKGEVSSAQKSHVNQMKSPALDSWRPGRSPKVKYSKAKMTDNPWEGWKADVTEESKTPQPIIPGRMTRSGAGGWLGGSLFQGMDRLLSSLHDLRKDVALALHGSLDVGASV